MVKRDEREIPAYYFTQKWIDLRKQVVTRDKRTCQYCGECPAFQADHIVPRNKGGKDELKNLVCCCPRCNKIAGGRQFMSFRHKKRFIKDIIKRYEKKESILDKIKKGLK